jgi:endonuclease/exonuclease/phosphatase family metal-dependent hydrolase
MFWCAIFLIATNAAVSPLVFAANDALRVMSFNIRYGTANDGDNAWDRRKELVAETIRTYEPVLVGLQECLGFQAEYLVEQLPEYKWFGVGREADGSGERMAVLYRPDVLNPLETGNLWLCKTPNVPGSSSWNSACNRMVTWGKFYRHADGRMVYFFNTHFDHRSEEARRGAAGVLAEQVNRIAGDEQVIVTGDFNARAEASVPWQTVVDAGFRDAWLEADAQEGPSVTWSGFKAPKEETDRRIDWILTRGALDVRQCETVAFNRDGRYPSDHFPVFAEIVFAEQE